MTTICVTLIGNFLNHTPERSLRNRISQNILHDPGIIPRKVSVIHPINCDYLIETGPGQDTLTIAVLGRGEEMIAIDLDRDPVIFLQ